MYSKTIIDTSFPKAWERAVKFVRDSPQKLHFGGGTEKKNALDSQVSIILDRNAVTDVLNHNIHPSDPFGTPNKIREYLKEYRADFNFEASGFDYTYRNRLESGFWHKDESDHNQLTALRCGLQDQIDEDLSSNRNVAILFNPIVDNFSGKSIPCWNEVLIRYEKNNMVSIHTTFRSHDLFGAWGSNTIAVLTMLNDEVVKPCGCHISYLSEHNYSLHIYENDLPKAKGIATISRNPILDRLQSRYDEYGF